MDIQKFSDYFKYNIMWFKLCGVWIDIKNLRSSSYVKIVYSFLVNLLHVLLPQICHVIYMYKARENVKAFADEFYVSISSVIVVFKSYTLVKNFATIDELVKSTDDEVFLPRNAYQWTQSDQIMGTWRKTYWAYTILELLFCLMLLISPLIDSIVNRIKLLPLVDCYPFPVFVSPIYEFMFVYQSLVLFWLCCESYNFDTLVTGLVSFTGLQCDILCDNLRNLKMEVRDGGDDVAGFKDKFLACIEHYKIIYGFVKDLEICFSWIILEQFAGSVITFCTTMFKISLSEPMTKEFFTILFYQGAGFLQLFIFCWAGTQLSEKSENISSAAYQSDWLKTPKEFKSLLLLFTHITQRPLKISTVLFPVSLQMFGQIIKSSFSYFTVLSTLNDK